MSPASSRKATKPTRKTDSASAQSKLTKPVGYEFLGLGLIAAGLLVLFASWSHGWASDLLQAVARWLFGKYGAVGVGVALIAIGVSTLVNLRHVRPSRTTLGVGIIFLVVISMAQLTQPAFTPALFQQSPGGFVGGGIAWIFYRLVGWLAWFILFIVGLGGVALMTDVPLWLILVIPFRGLKRAYLNVCPPVSPEERQRRHEERAKKVKELQEEEKRRRNRPEPEEAPEPSWEPPAREPAPVAERVPDLPPPRPAPPLPDPVLERAQAMMEAEEEEDEVKEPAPRITGVPSKKRVDQLQFAEDAIAPPSRPYTLPPTSMLAPPPKVSKAPRESVDSRIKTLEETLGSFGIEARVVGVEQGPRVTRFEIVPPPGIRINRITNLADNITLSLAADNVRVEAPVPGKGVVGIEVPNKELAMVTLREIIESDVFGSAKTPVTFGLGKDIAGKPRVADLTRMPHLLIAGATNSGKSVCINTLICSILMRATPQQVKFLMVDPKRVELSLFQSIPHLIAPVAYDAKHAAGLLRWAIREMEQRYEMFAEKGVRNIVGFNEQSRLEVMEELPYIVIIIDELADLMMQAAAEFEASICRLAQLARATGIHLVVATQRPSVNVITGTIKANIPSRIAFSVASQVDSRTILDMNGAERLVGAGDMLYLPVEASKPSRIQGCYVSEKEINRIVEHVKAQGKPHFTDEIMAIEEEAMRDKDGGGSSSAEGTGASEDELFERALDYVRTTKYASTSMLQRKFRIGYTRAARLMDEFEERGYVGPGQGSKPREVIFAPTSAVTGKPAGPTAAMEEAEEDIHDPFQEE